MQWLAAILFISIYSTSHAVRKRLVMIGGALVALGLLVVGIGLINLPSTTPATVDTSASTAIGTNEAYLTSVDAPPGATQGSLSVAWSANGPVDVYILDCNPTPPQNPPSNCILEEKMDAGSGSIDLASGSHWPYDVYVVNAGPNLVSISLGIEASAPAASGLPWWQTTGILVAGGLLAAIGAVAAFLGLFLASGAFAPPPEGEKEGPVAPETGEKEEDKMYW
jgi:hypothetical protein